MAYLVFARKYRPQVFEDVVEQVHVTRTLANAVTSDRLAHAILFSGPRGTGKTTIARILAKCMNCQAGPTPVPCNNCQSCREITQGNAVDVFEIDGASNNKVENIRELRENAKYMPAHSPYKIYIIDEVHMLSDSAFNALLKILEEPPAHVLFFFATTEPHKIPITILSRCQRYDLRRVDINAIVGHMKRICDEENIEISEKGLSIIAREADGSIRDGLSLLNQIITCSSTTITDEQIIEILGVIDRQVLFDISGALFEGDMTRLLEICDLLYRQGRHLMKFYGEMIEHFRNLLVVRMNATSDALAHVAEHDRMQMCQQVENVTEPYLTQILHTLFEDEFRIKQSVSPKLALEMTFFKLLQIRPALSIDTLIEKLDQLKSGDITPPVSDKAGPSGAGPSPAPSTPKTTEPAPDTSGMVSAAEIPEPPPMDEIPEQTAIPEEENSEETSPITQDVPQAASFDGLSLEQVWERLHGRIIESSPSLGACLVNGMLKSFDEHLAIIEVRSENANINLLNSKKSKANLENLCTNFFGRSMQVRVEIDNAGKESGNRKKEEKSLKDEALNHPVVDMAVKTFNGKVVDVKIL